jgi:hypothetical protein
MRALICLSLVLGFAVWAAGKKAPAPAKPKKEPTQFETCRDYAQKVSDTCGFKKDDSEKNCLVYFRLGKAGNCEDTIKGALRCTMETAHPRDPPDAGGRCVGAECDKYDEQLEHCLQTYCKQNAKDADCASLFP